MRVHLVLAIGTLLLCFSLGAVSALTQHDGSPPTFDRPRGIKEYPQMTAAHLLSRGDPALLRHGEIPYPDKADPPLPKTKALEDWHQKPVETRPLLMPGRTASDSKFWRAKSSPSTSRQKKSVGRAAGALTRSARKVGRFFKTSRHRRSLQLDSWEGNVDHFPANSLLKKRGQGLSKSKPTSTASTSSNPGIFSIGTPPSPNDRSSRASGSSHSSGLGMFTMSTPHSPRSSNTKSRAVSKSISPQRSGGSAPSRILASPSPPTRPATKSRSRSPPLARTGPSPSSSQAVWRPKSARDLSEIHKGHSAYEDWGRYLQPQSELKASWGGGNINISPKEVKTDKPTSKRPGGLSQIFG